MNSRPYGILAVALVLLPISPVLAGILIVLAAGWLGFSGQRPTPGKMWLALFLATFLSVLFSNDRLFSATGLLIVLAYFLVLWTVRKLADSTSRRTRLLQCIFWPTVAAALYGILGVLLGVRFHTTWGPLLIRLGTEDGRANSIFFHPNILAGYLLLSLGVGFYLLERAKRRWVVSLGLGVIAVCLVMTQSRSAWIGAALTLTLIGIRLGWRKSWKIFAAVGACGLVFYRPVLNRLSTLSSMEFLSNADRLRAWQSACEMIRQHPVLGFGPGSWAKVYPAYRNPLELEHLQHAHNLFLHWGVEYGLLALGCLLFLIGHELWQGFRKNTWPLACAIVGYLALSLFEFVFSEGRNAILFFTLLGMLNTTAKEG